MPPIQLTDNWCLMGSQIEWEVMSVPFVHYLKAKVGTVQNISPCIDHFAFRTDNALVKVEAIKIESHGRNAQASKPNTNNRPSSKEEMKTTAIVE